MTEPDFDQIAGVKELRARFEDMGLLGHEARSNELLDQIIRQVWNARGAADLQTVTAALLGEGAQQDGAHISMLESKLRRLDH